MISHIYPNFLEDVQEYKASVRHWEELWRQVGKCELEKYQWTYPWISTGSPDILDGNPIFSAFSPVLLRGIRIIQHEPTSSKLEIQAWPDYVGGDIADPASIRELAISCTLSSETARIALDLCARGLLEVPCRSGSRLGYWSRIRLVLNSTLAHFSAPSSPAAARSRGRAAIASRSPLWLQGAARRAASGRRG